MKLVIIAGDAAVGKMTVGQELAKQTGLRLFHNHVTIEPVIEVFGYYDSKIINKLRLIMFEEFARSDLDGMIFTCMVDYDNPVERLYVENIKSVFEVFLEEKGRELEFYYVELDASQETRLQRNTTENRLNNKPSKREIEVSNQRLIDDDKNGRFVSKEGEVEYDNFLRIINDNLSVAEQVDLIRRRFEF